LSKQQGKLAVPTVLAPAAFNAMTAHNPVTIFFEQEKQHAEVEHLQNL